jgi:hypothetical protein
MGSGTFSVGGGTTLTVSNSMYSASSSGSWSAKIKIPPPPTYFSGARPNAEVSDLLDPGVEFAEGTPVDDTARTGWYLPSLGNVIYASCAGVTREKFGSLSDTGSTFRDLSEDAEAFPSSARLEIEPLIGEMSPCFPDNGDSFKFISMSPSGSFFGSSFSSWLQIRYLQIIIIPSLTHHIHEVSFCRRFLLFSGLYFCRR